ncbi:SusC/RagA family TonB-linked outer membrane protein [Olivibacter sp. CPCC 100613]
MAINYEKNFGDHHFYTSILGDQRRLLFNYDLPAINTNLTGRLNYDYKGRYMAQAAVNTSGYNRYRPGYQYGLFYAFGLGWNIGEEDFIKDNTDWIDYMKVRATFGKTGNGVDNAGYYDYRATYKDNNGGIGSGAYLAGTERSELRGYWENTYLPNVRTWEGAYKLNIGTDIELFRDKLAITADFYHDRYFDLLQTRGKSIEIIGIEYPSENIGRMLVKGAEFTVGHRHRIGKLGYFLSANLSIEQSKVDFFDEQQQRYPWQQLTGLPAGVRSGYIAEGLYQSGEEAEQGASTVGYVVKPGDIKYRDLNGDGQINQFDRTVISSTKPLIYYGFQFGFNYKSFALTALVQGVQNREIYLADRAIHGGFLGFGGYEQAYEPVLNRWTPETADAATYPRLTIGNSHNYAESSFWIRSGNYLRLKNVELAYTFQGKLLEKTRLGSVRLFANALNVFTWSAFKGQDPEVAIGAYPLQRVFNLGLNVNL